MKIALSLFAFALADEICYDDFGCFTDDFPWSIAGIRPSRMPEKPENIETEFRLFTASSDEFELLHFDGKSWEDSGFNPGSETVFLVHGWQSSAEDWPQEGVEALLQLEDRKINAISVDWRKGAKILDYPQAAANSQLVGRQIGFLARRLVESGAIKAENIYVAGHSLGGQVAGYAGKYFHQLTGSKIGRITGLDPAGPMFQLPDWVDSKMARQLHLWRDDAEFVDVIHTTAGSLVGDTALGMSSLIGHADFFPNGGQKNQPGCHQVACHHGRAHQFWVSSVTRNCFQAFACDSYEAFKSDCNKTVINTNRMGYWATKPITHKSYFSDTSRRQPFCP